MTFRPGATDPGGDSPFAGRRLHVALASIEDRVAGEVAYQLDDGSVHYDTVEVDELLFGLDLHRLPINSWPPPTHDPVPPPPARPVATRPTPPAALSWEVSDYTLTPTTGIDGPNVEMIGTDSDGNLIAEFSGYLPGGDLSLVARCFSRP
ncbi:hypothetical protein [Micromonospora sp. NPDC048898]|uniref:hypothetical protein n=1 Tax=Micromonospora sp. NPDC048898 TaxID=3364260 RepID=UPI003719E1DF